MGKCAWYRFSLVRAISTVSAMAVEVCHGFPWDPGVEVAVARSTSTMDSAVPNTAQQSKSPWWRCDGVPRENVLFPSTTLASAKSTVPDFDGPAMMVQVTIFACSGTAIAVGLSHPLADAQSLAYFIQHWARFSFQKNHYQHCPPTFSHP